MSNETLRVERLVVQKSNFRVYDQSFHKGINIIRGANGTGKSTITDLLSFSLGSEITAWTEEQLLCDWVLVEVFINNVNLCLKREITETGKSPMLIFEGDFDSAVGDSENWFRYPNQRSKDKHSYSQELFELLGMPQHKTDDSRNLTMHQILRLMYVDQLTSTEKLLKSDSFDNSTIRRAIGEYLLGIDDLESHNLRQDLISANKIFESYNGELRAIYKMFGNDASSINRVALDNELNDVAAKIDELLIKRTEVQQSRNEELNEETKDKLNSIQSNINELNEKIQSSQIEKYEINTELVDTVLFLDTLEFRLNSLNDSQLVSNELGGISFKYCPSCLSPIVKNEDHDACGLCKANIKDKERDYAYIQMINELNFQINESKGLVSQFRSRVDSLNSLLPTLKRKLLILREEYQSLVSFTDSRDALLSEVSTEIGFYKSQIVNIEEKKELVGKVEGLIDKKQKSQQMINEIEENLEQLKFKNKNRYETVYESIEEISKTLLLHDGGYEKSFDDPSEIIVDFSKDRMAVNGRRKFSASSMVIMKNSIRLAIFLHAVNDKSSRIPGLFIMDNIEDKGMVADRSQNFQHLIIEQLKDMKNNFQLIFTTSMIADDLDNTDYCVGPRYLKGSHTLNFG